MEGEKPEASALIFVEQSLNGEIINREKFKVNETFLIFRGPRFHIRENNVCGCILSLRHLSIGRSEVQSFIVSSFGIRAVNQKTGSNDEDYSTWSPRMCISGRGKAISRFFFLLSKGHNKISLTKS